MKPHPNSVASGTCICRDYFGDGKDRVPGCPVHDAKPIDASRTLRCTTHGKTIVDPGDMVCALLAANEEVQRLREALSNPIRYAGQAIHDQLAAVTRERDALMAWKQATMAMSDLAAANYSMRIADLRERAEAAEARCARLEAALKDAAAAVHENCHPVQHMELCIRLTEALKTDG